MQTSLKLTIGLAALIAASGSAQAQDLFQDLSLEQSLRSNQVQLDGQFRSRQVAVNNQAMKDTFNKFSPAKSLSLDLFPGRSVTIQNTGFDRDLGDGYSNWSGRIAGFDDGFATLVVKGNRMIGQVQYGGEVYRITPKDNGVHVISELDLSQLPEEAPELVAPDSGETYAPGNRTSQAWTRLQIMVMYTPEAIAETAAAGVNYKDEARLAVGMANTANTNTALRSFKFKISGIQSTYCGYVEPADYSQPLYDITNASTCIGGKAAAKRNTNAADLVALVRSSGGAYCGVGWLNSTPSNPGNGFSLTSRNCISGHTFTHEVGHNLGLHHDRYVVSGHTPEQYNFGLARPELATPTRTVMAYNRACSDVGKFCTRAPLFTNTHTQGTWGGERFGLGAHRADAAVNRKKLKDNWAIIAGWR